MGLWSHASFPARVCVMNYVNDAYDLNKFVREQLHDTCNLPLLFISPGTLNFIISSAATYSTFNFLGFAFAAVERCALQFTRCSLCTLEGFTRFFLNVGVINASCRSLGERTIVYNHVRDRSG